MGGLFKCLRKLHSSPELERRKHPRKVFSSKIYYMVQGSWHKGTVKDISEGGAYVQSIGNGKCYPGDDILLVFQLRVLRDQIRGKVIRVGWYGMAIEFEEVEPVCPELKALLTDYCLPRKGIAKERAF